MAWFLQAETKSHFGGAMIRSATRADASSIAEIYNYYILNSVITFEEEIIYSSDMQERIAETQHSYPWLVYEDNGSIAGYAYASKWRSRCSYRNSVESTVYLHKDKTGRKIGSHLYSELIDKLEIAGFHTVIGGVALPNESSVALHEKLGFKKIAHFREVGWKFQRWVDVGYWQLIL
jgi:L-amino acid N-acyltransferase YncA